MKNKKDLILSLIKDNLINTRLLMGLGNLGLIADDYTLHLGDTIFKLMEFESDEQSDLIFEKVFIANTEKVMQTRFSRDRLTLLSMQIYEELVLAKEMNNKQR